MFVLISKRQNDFSISQAVYENKTLTKTSEQTVGSDFGTLMKNSSTFNRSVKLALILLQQKTVKLAAIFLQQKNGQVSSNSKKR